jgi:myo-inositol-1(or 4)-monophosphatase
MYKKELNISIKTVKKINKLLKKEFNSLGQTKIESKKHGEIVTETDKKANQIIINTIKKYFPKDNIISEEAPEIKNNSTRTWYVDPLDATTNFAYGFKEFTTHIAFAVKDDIKVGVIGVPLTNEIYWAQKNKGAFVNNKKISVQKPKHKKIMALICGGHTTAGIIKLNKIFKNLNNQNARVRVFAAAGIEMTSVATGKADLCIMTDVHPWDVAPGVVIAREAGATITNFKGETWKLKDKNIIVGASKKLHKIALSQI